MSNVPPGLRGHLPELTHPDVIPVPSHVYCDELGPQVPLRSNDTRQWRAKTGMMLRVLVGSGVHGTAVAGQDDTDEMAIAIEPPETVFGWGKFDHYEYRTAEPDGPGKTAVCSGPGDLDLIVYSLRRWVELAAAGNPTLLVSLSVGDKDVRYTTQYGLELRERAAMFASRHAAGRFIGYLGRQREGLLGLRSGGTNNQGRADIRAKYGYDVKFAMHMCRLGIQGVEFLTTGRITLPVPEPELTYLRDVRQGKYTLQETLDRAAELEKELLSLQETSRLPEQVDREALDRWVADVHRRHWGWT